MSEDVPARPEKSPFHMAVLALWFMVCAWLVGSLLSGVISSLFLGDGPVDYPPVAGQPASAPEPSPGP